MSLLDDIKAYKLADIAERKRRRPLRAVEEAARAAPSVRDFLASLNAAKPYGLICEIKRASPSKGLIRKDFNPADLARAYEAGGAACLSVLTDGPSFEGEDAHLVAARGAVALPVLRKDFLYEPYQVIESRALGADCILVIMATVTDDQARDLESAARQWDMTALLEVHDEAELERALKLESRLVGINNRDLRTFETSLAVTERLAPLVPEDRLVVAESGLATRADLDRLARAGVTRFLIGEALMRQPDVEAATRALLQ